jgi:hypothetical protein
MTGLIPPESRPPAREEAFTSVSSLYLRWRRSLSLPCNPTCFLSWTEGSQSCRRGWHFVVQFSGEKNWEPDEAGPFS